MNKKLITVIMMCFMFGMSGCNDSSQTGENSVPKKEWVDIRGTEVTLQSDTGVRVCVAVPNGVFAVNHNDEISIEFEDFDSFSNSSIKHLNNLKVGVSSVFIRPESISSLAEKKIRLINLKSKYIKSHSGFEYFLSDFGGERDKLNGMSIINIDKSIGIRFFAGKKIIAEYEKDGVLNTNELLDRLATEISAITHNCTKE